MCAHCYWWFSSLYTNQKIDQLWGHLSSIIQQGDYLIVTNYICRSKSKKKLDIFYYTMGFYTHTFCCMHMHYVPAILHGRGIFGMYVAIEHIHTCNATNLLQLNWADKPSCQWFKVYTVLWPCMHAQSQFFRTVVRMTIISMQMQLNKNFK